MALFLQIIGAACLAAVALFAVASFILSRLKPGDLP